MLLTRYEPFGLFGHFGNEMNRMLAGNRSEGNTAVERDWTPAVDIREEEDRFVLVADIPGVSRKDVEITLDDGVLTVKGERRMTAEESGMEHHRRERVHGRFARQFTLPDTVDAEHISATVTEGVLEIVIAKAEKPQPRKISVN
jgi:HSP20 family protein